MGLRRFTAIYSKKNELRFQRPHLPPAKQRSGFSRRVLEFKSGCGFLGQGIGFCFGFFRIWNLNECAFQLDIDGYSRIRSNWFSEDKDG